MEQTNCKECNKVLLRGTICKTCRLALEKKWKKLSEPERDNICKKLFRQSY